MLRQQGAQTSRRASNAAADRNNRAPGGSDARMQDELEATHWSSRASTGGLVVYPRTIRQTFRSGLDGFRTTPFQRQVLEVVKGIPRGEVKPYAWVASEVGSPKASRAVGMVMANNPVPLLIPCHRVVKNDGTTGRYAFGAEEKVRLLEGEGVPVGELAGSPYLATPTTGIFCHATCRNARRIKPENRQRFRSAEAAIHAGFRPCKVCRPVMAE